MSELIYKCRVKLQYSSYEKQDYQVVENNGLGRAVAGGLLLGGVGAIVGATTAKQKIKTKSELTLVQHKVDGELLLLDDSLRFVADDQSIIIPANCLKAVKVSWLGDVEPKISKKAVRCNVNDATEREQLFSFATDRASFYISDGGIKNEFKKHLKDACSNVPGWNNVKS